MPHRRAVEHSHAGGLAAAGRQRAERRAQADLRRWAAARRVRGSTLPDSLRDNGGATAERPGSASGKPVASLYQACSKPVPSLFLACSWLSLPPTSAPHTQHFSPHRPTINYTRRKRCQAHSQGCRSPPKSRTSPRWGWSDAVSHMATQGTCSRDIHVAPRRKLKFAATAVSYQ
jgi:hypothetical protein